MQSHGASPPPKHKKKQKQKHVTPTLFRPFSAYGIDGTRFAAPNASGTGPAGLLGGRRAQISAGRPTLTSEAHLAHADTPNHPKPFRDFCDDWVGDDALCATTVPPNVELVVLACPAVFVAVAIISTLYLTEKTSGSATWKLLLGIVVAGIYAIRPWLVIKLASLVAGMYCKGEWLLQRSKEVFKSKLQVKLRKNGHNMVIFADHKNRAWRRGK